MENSKIEIRYEDIAGTMTPIKRSFDAIGFTFKDEQGKINYFKENNTITYDYNEILASILAKSLNVPTVKPIPCVYIDENGNKHHGIVSKDYVKNRKLTRTVNLEELEGKRNVQDQISVNEIQSIVNKFVAKQTAEYGSKFVLDKDLYLNLKKLSVMFYLTGQLDKMKKNIEFIFQKQKDGAIMVSLAPFFDNSLVFFVNILNLDYIIENKDLLVKDNYNRITLGSYNYVKDLAKEVLKNESMKEFYNKIMMLNYADSINRYVKKYGKDVLTQESIDRALIYFETARDLLNLAVRKQKKEIKRPKNNKVLEYYYQFANVNLNEILNKQTEKVLEKEKTTK